MVDRPSHARAHPLAGRVVIPNSSLHYGGPVQVVDWMDREPCLSIEAAHRVTGWYRPDENSVLIRDRMGFALLPSEDLPAYDPQPAGYVS
ncbi:hypothetical protein MKK70_04920 [Methylobacterium sp. E-041]|uniref:hypothetical protein n=1 Tax=Methylobacterium sp. E-041 TaxID=2836573 RepID=UPI001FB9F830|nr:hypothetical protein [Methylobacterium sp. E-041]MCJ2104729.1 hypothetical protein [Methylobacterium sp. E-041]